MIEPLLIQPSFMQICYERQFLISMFHLYKNEEGLNRIIMEHTIFDTFVCHEIDMM